MRSIKLVAHTHWDREWYLSFGEFQAKLIPTMDLVLDLLNDVEGWSHFHLDGQTAMIEDYLELRPEREADIRRHVASGALSVGPWVTLVDEFLVSGESIIRNLEDGIARARDLGEEPAVAYLPDQFGHIGQMPQLLSSFGLHQVVVWRGVPSRVTQTRFGWISVDGSMVRAFYLPFGYGQGARIESVEAAFVERIKSEVRRSEPFLAAGEPALIPVGNDHEPPLENLPRLIDHARSTGVDVELTSYAAHLSPSEQLEHLDSPTIIIEGELRSGARANLLPNTYSVRPQQKVERARAEHLLERYAEPLAALVPGVPWPQEDLSSAWYLLHLNGAHDSVCGCSTDEVAGAVDDRTAEAAETASEIISQAFGRLAAAVRDTGVLVFNPSPFERFGVPALGWRVMEFFEPGPVKLTPEARGREAVLYLDDTEIAVSVEDQGDAGDLYTFAPDGDRITPDVSVDDDARFSTERSDVSVSAWRVPTENFLRIHIEVENRAPDHRLRLSIALPETATGSIAGAPFEVVHRPLEGEGGDSEPPSRCWPARGFAFAGGRGVLAEGVFEYEVTEGHLAVTLMRCTGNISRGPMEVRKEVAGPDVPTPGAQLLGEHSFDFGVTLAADGVEAVRLWECFALEPLVTAALGEGELPGRGSLLDLDVPALSSIRRIAGEVVATVWNPARQPLPARIGAKEIELGPHRIEKVTAPAAPRLS